ncbi:hypothetical protein BpHYR1_008720 [Brachionus plicatilis]|uniref:Uncharacterized protein n=1 Tax=Brachionus plicatilis TaxID=10195 RepID=A0A3M7SQM7_BRAPC|nr:hypothetical protein BpHYR1_008720 [Brachionus plicatilis]
MLCDRSIGLVLIKYMIFYNCNQIRYLNLVSKIEKILNESMMNISKFIIYIPALYYVRFGSNSLLYQLKQLPTRNTSY